MSPSGAIKKNSVENNAVKMSWFICSLIFWVIVIALILIYNFGGTFDQSHIPTFSLYVFFSFVILSVLYIVLSFLFYFIGCWWYRKEIYCRVDEDLS